MVVTSKITLLFLVLAGLAASVDDIAGMLARKAVNLDELLCGLDDLSWDSTQQVLITNIQVKNALHASCVQPDFGYSAQLCSVVMDEAFKLTEDSGIFDEVAQCPQVRGLVEEHFRHQTFLHVTSPALLQRAGAAGTSKKLDTALRDKNDFSRWIKEKTPKFP